jgi:hypothetical protein
MNHTVRRINMQGDETQFAAIRDLMIEASNRGAWLTLAEIAESTEFGEASISAQLRHMRKLRFGHYRVDKRRRELSAGGFDGRSGYLAIEGLAAGPGEMSADTGASSGEQAGIRVGIGERDGVGCRSEQWESRRPAEAHSFAPWEYRAFTQPQVSGELIFERDATASGDEDASGGDRVTCDDGRAAKATILDGAMGEGLDLGSRR